MKTILLKSLTIWLFVVAVEIIITFSLIIKSYLGTNDGVKTWFYIGYAVEELIDILLLLFDIFAVHHFFFSFRILVIRPSHSHAKQIRKV